MEHVDILHHLAHIVGDPLSLLIGILPKVSKRCGAAAEQTLAMLVYVDMNWRRKKPTDEEISAVIRKCPNIKKLSLSCCNNKELSIEALKTNSVLQTLDLSYTTLNGKDSAFEAFRMNSTLKELNVSGNYFWIRGTQIMTNFLKTNTTITALKCAAACPIPTLNSQPLTLGMRTHSQSKQ